METGDSQVGADVLYSLDRAVLVQHTSCMHVAAALRLVAYVFGDILAGLEVGELHLHVDDVDGEHWRTSVCANNSRFFFVISC